MKRAALFLLLACGAPASKIETGGGRVVVEVPSEPASDADGPLVAAWYWCDPSRRRGRAAGRSPVLSLIHVVREHLHARLHGERREA